MPAFEKVINHQSSLPYLIVSYTYILYFIHIIIVIASEFCRVQSLQIISASKVGESLGKLQQKSCYTFWKHWMVEKVNGGLYSLLRTNYIKIILFDSIVNSNQYHYYIDTHGWDMRYEILIFTSICLKRSFLLWPKLRFTIL